MLHECNFIIVLCKIRNDKKKVDEPAIPVPRSVISPPLPAGGLVLLLYTTMDTTQILITIRRRSGPTAMNVVYMYLIIQILNSRQKIPEI